MEMDVEYNPQGPLGQQCQDCQFFEPSGDDASRGKCYGQEVMAQGTCNMFAHK